MSQNLSGIQDLTGFFKLLTWKYRHYRSLILNLILNPDSQFPLLDYYEKSTSEIYQYRRFWNGPTDTKNS